MITVYYSRPNPMRDTRVYIREDIQWINCITREPANDELCEKLEEHRRSSLSKVSPVFTLHSVEDRYREPDENTYLRTRDRRVVAEVDEDARFLVIDPPAYGY